MCKSFVLANFYGVLVRVSGSRDSRRVQKGRKNKLSKWVVFQEGTKKVLDAVFHAFMLLSGSSFGFKNRSFVSLGAW